MNLSNLKPRPGSRHRIKRLGCGESSGHGKTSGKGHKGQKARSGGSIRLGFEGGQMPLIRRVPKRGFNNKPFKTTFSIIKLSDLDASFADGATVDKVTLLAAGLIRKPYKKIKLLSRGEIHKKLNIFINKSSNSAKIAIEKAGGKLILSD